MWIHFSKLCLDMNYLNLAVFVVVMDLMCLDVAVMTL